MNSINTKQRSLRSLISANAKYIPAGSAILLFVLAFAVLSVVYGDKGFFTLRTIFGIFTDNAYLGISAVGMTFVIISGGIDLSVGAVAALTTMIISFGNAPPGSEEATGFAGGLGLPMPLCIIFALFVGTFLGFLMGVLIQTFSVPPFVATLGGMFFARGMCFVISIYSISIKDVWFRSIASWRINIPDFLSKRANVKAPLNAGFFVLVVMLILGIVVLSSTKFGRNVYALGGNEESAKLMGLPVGRTRIQVYAFNGFCSALAGIVFDLTLLSGYSLHLLGMELDIVAAVVIGGTLLTGGVGYPLGSLFGMLIKGIIIKFKAFNGNLEAGWVHIVTGALLLLFILIQRFVVMFAENNRETQTIGKATEAKGAKPKKTAVESG